MLLNRLTRTLGLAAGLFGGLALSGHALSMEAGVADASIVELAPPEQALTLAQIQRDGQHHTLLLLRAGADQVDGINLSRHFNSYPHDSLTLVRNQGYQSLAGLLRLALSNPNDLPLESIDRDALLPTGGPREHQLAAGANYEEHGEETDIDEVFLFPKFSPASGAVVTMAGGNGRLLDYEVELCMRWDRDLTSLADLRQAQPGLFLCGDFTDRAEMLRRLDVDNITSGHGFTDAKSGADRFPTGPWLVVPADWRQLLPDLALRTYVGTDLRQHARADSMILQPDALVERVLAAGQEPDWRYRDQPVALLSGNGSGIRQGESLLTGTPAGVVFNAPGPGYYVTTIAHWLVTLSFLDSAAMDYLVEALIEDGLASGDYLMPGDQVRLEGRYLGSIEVTVTDG